MIRDDSLREMLGGLARTVEAVFPEEDLVRKLASGRPLRVKLGLDPTSPVVHIGNAIQLWILRRFQDLGHEAVLILGDYTGLVGDPSGRDRTRPTLTEEQVEENLGTWREQIGAVLDPAKVRFVRNSEWFSRMSFLEIMDLTNSMTVQQMMERDSFQRRWEEQNPISVREFIYCLMQGWDSVAVRADVELGGADQTFNLTVGRRLMAREGLEPQVCLTTPLLEGVDGQAKMSKSLGNAIGVSESPRDMFGMAMRVSDELMPRYLRLATSLEDAQIDALLAGDAMEAKLQMAEALVRRYHGEETAAREREEFLRVFSRRDLPSEIPECALGAPGEDGRHWIVDLLKASDFASSTAEARRLVEGGAVWLGEEKVLDWRARLLVQPGQVLRAGRRRYARLLPPATA